MILRELSPEEFTSFGNSYNICSIYQTVEYGETMKKQNFEVLYIGLLNEENQIIAASLLLVQKKDGFKYAYAPRGFLLNYNNFELLKIFTKKIKKYLGKLDIIAVKLNPYIIKQVTDKEGHILDRNENYEQTYQNLKQLGYYHLGYNNYFEAFKPRFEAIIDLNQPYYQLWRNMSKNFRTKIRSAERNGVNIHRGNKNNLDYLYFQTKGKYPRDLKFFQDAYDCFGKNDKIEFYYAKINTTYYLTKTQELFQHMEQETTNINNEILKNNAKISLIDKKLKMDKKVNDCKNSLIEATNLLRDYPSGLIAASALIIKHTDEITLFIDGYDSNYKRFNAKHLLIWKIIEKYAKAGYRKFNLGGISSIYLPVNPYKGLNEFKLSFDAKAYEYIGDLELITNSALYFMYRNAAPIRGIIKK